MLFINEDRVRAEILAERPPLYDLQGRKVSEGSRDVAAQFERNTAPEWARDHADKVYVYARKPEGVTNGEWLCSYDSEEDQRRMGWTDEERETIERTLLERGYLRVEREKTQPPWPKYDTLVAGGRGKTTEMVVEQIVKAVETLGIDPDAVVVYERENLNRQAVIDAMVAFQPAAQEEDPEPLIAA